MYLIIMAVCLVLSAYFSATETAFSTMNRTRMKTLAEDNKRAKLALELSEKYDKLITTILIGNNIVNIALSSIATLFFVDLLKNIDTNTAATVSTAVVTVAVLIFGEVTPKSIAKDIPEKIRNVLRSAHQSSAQPPPPDNLRFFRMEKSDIQAL